MKIRSNKKKRIMKQKTDKKMNKKIQDKNKKKQKAVNILEHNKYKQIK